MKKAVLLPTAAANFIAAFGGGAVLGKGVNVAVAGHHQFGSLLAFFVGTALGLALLMIGKWAKRTSSDIWVAILGSLSAFVLYALYATYAGDNGRVHGIWGGVFFACLCIRFALWFLSRIMRGDRYAAVDRSSLPLIEGFFHTGTVASLGLAAMGVLTLSLSTILLVDGLCQAIAGGMDALGIHRAQKDTSTRVSETHAAVSPVRKSFTWTQHIVAVSLFCLSTLWVQVVLFHLAHLWVSRGSSWILMGFYGSLAIVGVASSRAPVAWKGGSRRAPCLTMGNDSKHVMPIPFLWLISLLAILSLLLLPEIRKLPFLLVALVLVAGMAYEVFVFSILDLIAKSGAFLGIPRPVARAFGVLAFVSAVSMAVFRYFRLAERQLIWVVLIMLLIEAFLVFGLRKEGTFVEVT